MACDWSSALAPRSQHSGDINPFTRAGVQLQLCQDLAWVGGQLRRWQLLLPRPRSPSLCSLSQPGCGPRWSPRSPTRTPTFTSSSSWVTQPEPQLRLSSSTACALGQALRGEGLSLGARDEELGDSMGFWSPPRPQPPGGPNLSLTLPLLCNMTCPQDPPLSPSTAASPIKVVPDHPTWSGGTPPLMATAPRTGLDP